MPSKLTLEFYERCNGCTSGAYGRPYFKKEIILNGTEHTINVALNYVITILC